MLSVCALALLLAAPYRASADCCVCNGGTCFQRMNANDSMCNNPSNCNGNLNFSSQNDCNQIMQCPQSQPTNTPGGPIVTPTPAFGEISCTDGIDNDQDGATDCADSQCIGEPTCSRGASTMSFPLMGTLIAALGAFAVLSLVRRRESN